MRARPVDQMRVAFVHGRDLRIRICGCVQSLFDPFFYRFRFRGPARTGVGMRVFDGPAARRIHYKCLC